MKQSLDVGDTIKCHNKAEAIMYMTSLAEDGIDTDFLYQKDGQKGFWLEVTKIQKGMPEIKPCPFCGIEWENEIGQLRGQTSIFDFLGGETDGMDKT